MPINHFAQEDFLPEVTKDTIAAAYIFSYLECKVS